HVYVPDPPRLFFVLILGPPRPTLFPYNDALPICRAWGASASFGGVVRLVVVRLAVRVGAARVGGARGRLAHLGVGLARLVEEVLDRKSTRLNSSHVKISYAVFCLKKKTNKPRTTR